MHVTRICSGEPFLKREPPGCKSMKRPPRWHASQDRKPAPRVTAHPVEGGEPDCGNDAGRTDPNSLEVVLARWPRARSDYTWRAGGCIVR